MKKTFVRVLILAGIFLIGYFATTIRNIRLNYLYYKYSCDAFKNKDRHVWLHPWIPSYEVYSAANCKLPTPELHKRRIIFFGDSITLRWYLPSYFSDLNLEPVNRGIGSEKTTDMLTRYIQDVIKLKPTGVIILAGTNDVMSLHVSSTDTTTNIALMSELASSRGIDVFLGTIPPTSEPKLNDKDDRPLRRRKIRNDINLWIKTYCRKKDFYLLNYYDALVDENEMLRSQYSVDAIHLNDDGYRIISSIVKTNLLKTLNH